MVDKQKHSDVWFVSVDGSEHSRQAFDQCYKEFYTKEDSLIVCSITDQSKTYLPYEFRSETIRSHYHTFLLSNIHGSKYRLIMEEKGDEFSIKDRILQEAELSKASAIFIGFSGRKGLKADPTLMGSTVRHAVLKTSVPIFITKKLRLREKTRTGGFTYLLCLDGGKKSLKGFEICKKLATNPNDQVIGCIVKSPEVESQIPFVREQFQNFVKQSNIKGEFITLDYSQVRGDGIVDFVNKKDGYYVDFVLFGNSGLKTEQIDQTVLGSVADYLISNLHSNLILLP